MFLLGIGRWHCLSRGHCSEAAEARNARRQTVCSRLRDACAVLEARLLHPARQRLGTVELCCCVLLVLVVVESAAGLRGAGAGMRTCTLGLACGGAACVTANHTVVRRSRCYLHLCSCLFVAGAGRQPLLASASPASICTRAAKTNPLATARPLRCAVHTELRPRSQHRVAAAKQPGDAQGAVAHQSGRPESTPPRPPFFRTFQEQHGRRIGTLCCAKAGARCVAVATLTCISTSTVVQSERMTA